MGGLVIRDELMQINQEEVWNSDKIERTEKFVDEFAIGFAEWCLKEEIQLPLDDGKELLEIYKKEKTL